MNPAWSAPTAIFNEGLSLQAVEARTPMKLACASSAFDRALARGDLTQLEFLELSARSAAADGVVLDAGHFPRTDADYLAQVRKMAIDLGLDVAALRDDDFLKLDETAMQERLARAVAVGAPLLCVRLASETATSWGEQLRPLSLAARLAKAANVTLALRNVPGSHAADAQGLRHAAKDVDSAWLRFGVESAALDDPVAIAQKLVLLWQELSEDAETALSRLTGAMLEFRGYLALDARNGEATSASMATAVGAYRVALAQRLLAALGNDPTEDRAR
ncbi:MAG: hypothetical protein ACYDA5_00725 [Vulcanimicrobiaceae bacterium]